MLILKTQPTISDKRNRNLKTSLKLTEKIKDEKLIIYIHGKGGNADEARHFKSLFADCDVIGFDYKAKTMRYAKKEFLDFFDLVSKNYDSTCIIANSIGAFYAMNAFFNKKIACAYFISRIVNMERLITDMMMWANVSEYELMSRKEIPTNFGETLSWEYLCYVRKHQIE